VSAAPDPRYVTVAAAELERIVAEVFSGVGLAGSDPSTVASVLVDANLRGIDSHGVERAPVYLRRVHAGVAGGSERIRTLVDSGPMCRIDAGHALGPIVSVAAIDRAVELAEQFGISIVSVGRSSHFGAAGFYARHAAQRGMISIVLSNAAGSMTPHGAKQAFLGANPLAIAVPLGRHGQFVLDMSTSIAARGRMRRAQAAGQQLPSGVAVDGSGRPTTDPGTALLGAVLPVGGAKGSGLAVALTLITSYLSEADFDDEIGSMYQGAARPQNLGHVFLAIDPSKLADAAQSEARAEAMIDRLHALTPAESFDDVIFAGERQSRVAQQRAQHGIPVARHELLELVGAAADCGMQELAERIRATADGDVAPT
jgi:LDH2 family malate/lactate/ureidoglycolate dehydrogenase